MACNYTFNGKVYSSYQELIDSLDSAEINSALSILFSLEDKQAQVYDSLMALKREHQFKQWEKSNFNSMDGEPSIDVKDGMSIQQFIDSAYFTIDGDRPVFQMNFEEYLERKTKELVESKAMSEEDATAYVTVMEDRWEKIAQDSFDLHRLVVSTKGKGEQLTYQELSQSTVGTSFQSIPDKIEEVSSAVIKKVFLKNGSDKVGGGAKGRLIKNINLQDIYEKEW